jgi:hypothetical protein
MEERLTTSIVLYGGIDTVDSSVWLGFYHYAVGLIEGLNLNPNYLGITGKSFKSGKITTLNRTQKKLIKSLDEGEGIESLEIYSLPDDFTTAAFDYEVYICRTSQLDPPHLITTFSNHLFDLLDHGAVISKLKEFINFESGQVFELKSLESPQIYASRANSPAAFKSLTIIRDLT